MSYSHEGERPGGPWMSTVRAFADLLNENGIDADLDQYGNHLDRDWGLWGPQAVESAEIIVCIASPDYLKKWQTPSGWGVADEARTIRAKLATGGTGVLLALLPGRSKREIPLDMRTRNYAAVQSINEDGIDEVLRLLTDQPRTLKTPPPARRPTCRRCNGPSRLPPLRLVDIARLIEHRNSVGDGPGSAGRCATRSLASVGDDQGKTVAHGPRVGCDRRETSVSRRSDPSTPGL